MKDNSLSEVVTQHLREEGCFVHAEEAFLVDSLQYLSLLSHLEITHHFPVDVQTFYSYGLPGTETLQGLCERLQRAANKGWMSTNE